MTFSLTTFVASLLAGGLLSGVLATIIAKLFDARADRRRASLADGAADRAVERHFKTVRGEGDLQRRAAQGRTVDTLSGHAHSLLTEACKGSPDGSAYGLNGSLMSPCDGRRGWCTQGHGRGRDCG